MLKSPYVYFGGKSKIMPLVWQYLGDVDNFVDPFVGSLASILCRPDWHQRKAETVNDKDGFIANFWRTLQADPETVAHYADWPVIEVDLLARHIWLINQGRESLKRLEGDSDYYDAKVAGWWVWGINAWIGSGWCSGNGSWNVDESGMLVKVEENGVVNRRPHLGDRGRGINRQRPHLGSRGQDKLGKETNTDQLIAYMRQLADRLRGVRICTGDWTRIVTTGALAYGDTVGVFLDPPYSAETDRDMTLYTHETECSAAVYEWALANGDDPRMRIVLCGYADEHAMPAAWSEIGWIAGASYQNSGGNGRNNTNRKRERIWISPHCIGQMQMTL